MAKGFNINGRSKVIWLKNKFSTTGCDGHSVTGNSLPELVGAPIHALISGYIGFGKLLSSLFSAKLESLRHPFSLACLEMLSTAMSNFDPYFDMINECI